MAAYGGKTPKRHVMYSNTKAIGALDMGKLCFDYSDPSYKNNQTTQKKVVIKDGKRKVAFQGRKQALNQSQWLGSIAARGISVWYTCLLRFNYYWLMWCDKLERRL